MSCRGIHVTSGVRVANCFGRNVCVLYIAGSWWLCDANYVRGKHWIISNCMETQVRGEVSHSVKLFVQDCSIVSKVAGWKSSLHTCQSIALAHEWKRQWVTYRVGFPLCCFLSIVWIQWEKGHLQHAPTRLWCCTFRIFSGIEKDRPVNFCRNPGSNQGPSDLQSDALPAELFRPAAQQLSTTK